MCNLYSMSKDQQAIRELAGAMRDTTGNLPMLPGLFPDYAAPIVRNGVDGVRELVMARWGMPSPAFALQDKKVDRGVTNVRNTASPHWRRWLVPAARRLVPFTSFSEPGLNAEGKSEPVWFALDDSRPLAFLAGIWTGWTSTRKVSEGEVHLRSLCIFDDRAERRSWRDPSQSNACHPHGLAGPRNLARRALA